ncbi:MAG: hypothetical protein GOVbin3695_54 [Prokaryotic dsDNA virus sp.]|nr:MAG: hypothetical protein GOVbin3695_54 [Prokaryotic dsDNA virus sp.]|tara:strand:+ start:2709 stop:3698 length:990 start_codon:yes stop_codon:yes gene_type:complete
MGNRVLIGQRSSNYGVFISKSGDNVLTTTNPLSFDSRAAESLQVHSYGQGILVPDVTNSSGTALTFTYEGTTYSNHEVDITHNLGYIPAFAVRWCTKEEMAIHVPQAFPTSSTSSASPLATTGKDFGVNQKVVVSFGAYLDTGATLNTNTAVSTSSTLAKQTGKYVHITKGTVDSNVTLSVTINDNMDNGSDSGRYTITATLSSGTSGAYEVLCEIRDNAGATYFHKVSGTVYSTDRTGVEVATKVWSPHYVNEFESQYNEDEDSEMESEGSGGLSVTQSNTTNIRLENHVMKSEDGENSTHNSMGDKVVYFYSYVIFTAENFLNGESM